MPIKLNLLLIGILYNTISVKAEPPNASQIYTTTTALSCIVYLIVIFLYKEIKILYKYGINKRNSKIKRDNHIESIASSEDSSTSLVNIYENVKDIESTVPPSIKAYISQQQWTDQIDEIKLNNTHRNSFFSFHPLLFPVWKVYLNTKVHNNASNNVIQEIEKEYSRNVGDKVIMKICLILVVEDFLCFIFYYWFAKFMVKKNHATFTSHFIRSNEYFKNENIPLLWVLDWKSPKYDLYGFTEQCFIELHVVEEDNIIYNNIFDAYSLALQEDKNSIYSKIGINVVLHDKKFSKKSIQWCNYSEPSHLYTAINKLTNSNIVKDISLTNEPPININQDVEHVDFKLYPIGEKNGKEIVYNYINTVPNSYRTSESVCINQDIEMELDQKTNQELSKKYGFSVDPSLLLQQYQNHPNPEIAFIGKELYHYIKETIQYRIRKKGEEMDYDNENDNNDNDNHSTNYNNNNNKCFKSPNSTYVLVFEWKYPPETFQKIPLWNNRLKRKAYICHDWTKNESASNSSRHFVFGTKSCLINIYYSILKRIPRLFEPLRTNNFIFEPNIIKHRIFPKPYLKDALSSMTLFNNNNQKFFDKSFLQTQSIQNLRKIIYDHDLYDEINMDLGSDKHGFNFEKNMPYGYFKIKLEKYPLCFQNFLWNCINEPILLNQYLNDTIPVEVQWNYQIPEFLISMVKNNNNDENNGEGGEMTSTLKVSTFILKNNNPDIYWCFCQRRMLTTDYYHHCEKYN
ncbi:hypothetical protein BCR32DRAFT_271912 [Anaeromyces robustus]|uniref:Uncharacterized protein n=1 Tax=Anaeromyces robustus TaxID=1754192 RepID=A0A1Y1WPI4_9FUNG|nr:hypothetical protein BCR32DRAFT_271912 [Anaeromyces robustus]|eukprot:ORX75430.1 hypothetical protein BCR32DRAFT_271912 [Anaeromyces robustus]